MKEEAIYIPFQDIPHVDSLLVELANNIQKAIPNVVFNQGEVERYNIPIECEWVGVTTSLDVYFDDSLNKRVSVIGRQKFDGKFWIVNRNVESSRRYYGRGEGQLKSSIHAKNILATAKKTIHPLTIFQVIDEVKSNFEGAVANIRNKWSWQVNRQTDSAFDLAYEDMIHLHSIGYAPKTQKFASAMNYLAENKAEIDKYSRYDPDYSFVWVKPNSVEYIKKGSKEPQILASLNELPEDIRGKMFVLDISNEKEFVEDIGLRQDSVSYWVIA